MFQIVFVALINSFTCLVMLIIFFNIPITYNNLFRIYKILAKIFEYKVKLERKKLLPINVK